MSKRILVVEDQPDSRRIIRDMLTADHGWLHRHTPDQSRSRAAINSNYRGHLLCARRGGEDREGGRL
jgi:CheY-like chemotaxis protein